MWELEQAAKLTKAIIEQKLDLTISDEVWRCIIKQYMENKQKLINFLDPKTGRTEITINQTNNIREVFESTINYHICRSPITDYVLNNVYKFTSKLDKSELLSGYIQKSNGESGTRITKEIAKIIIRTLKEYKCEHQCQYIPAVIGKVWEDFKCSVNTKLVISANILDLAFPSDFSSFSTCYRIDGQNYASAFEFINNKYTLIIYIYNSTTQNMPNKIWRQIIHCDLHNKALVFMPSYGKNLGWLSTKQITKVLQNLILPAENQYLKTNQSKMRLRNVVCSKTGIYTDSPVKTVYLNKIPHILLSYRTACLGCGRATIKEVACKLCLNQKYE